MVVAAAAAVVVVLVDKTLITHKNTPLFSHFASEEFSQRF
jgi:hypothetical protein